MTGLTASVWTLINARHLSDISEVGRSARVYCELASRLEPTLSDVHLALIDVGTCKGGILTTEKVFTKSNSLTPKNELLCVYGWF